MSTAASSSTPARPVQASIERKLRAAFDPVSFLQVDNESYKHSVPRDAETHFRVVVVSPAFAALKLLERHRAVNTALADELEHGGVHALSIQAKTPEQWAASAQRAQQTPNCLGGSKADAR